MNVREIPQQFVHRFLDVGIQVHGIDEFDIGKASCQIPDRATDAIQATAEILPALRAIEAVVYLGNGAALKMSIASQRSANAARCGTLSARPSLGRTFLANE